MQGRPIAFLSWLAVVVQVVRIGIEIEAGTVGIVHTEDAPHEFLVVFAVGILTIGQTTAQLSIGNPSLRIFLLQLHVHHQLFLHLLLLPRAEVFLRCAVVRFHPLHRERRQVLQHHALVLTHQFLTVQQQFLHFSPVHRDFASAFQFHAWQLLDEGIEHGAFCQFEGIGIEHQRVAIVVELHLRCFYHDFIEHISIEEGRCLLLGKALQIDGLELTIQLMLVESFDAEWHEASLVALGIHSYQIVARLLQIEISRTVSFVIVFV